MYGCGEGGEVTEDTEVSREFTAEVLPGIPVKRTPLVEGRGGCATPELSVA
jgi:hypothetical protein